MSDLDRLSVAFNDAANLPAVLPCDVDFLDWPCTRIHDHQRRDGRAADPWSCHAGHRDHLFGPSGSPSAIAGDEVVR